MPHDRPTPGIGSPALDLADDLTAAAFRLEAVAGTLSGVGDVLYLYARLFERAGIPRTEIIGMLDAIVAQVDDSKVGERNREGVAAALSSRLVEGMTPKPPRLRLVETKLQPRRPTQSKV